jgi:hypothetical protein
MAAPAQAQPTNTPPTRGTKINQASEVKSGLIYQSSNNSYIQLQEDGRLFVSEKLPISESSSFTYSSANAPIQLATLISLGLFTTSSTTPTPCNGDREVAIKERSSFYTNRLDPLIPKNIDCAVRLLRSIDASIKELKEGRADTATIDNLTSLRKSLYSHIEAFNTSTKGTEAYYKQVAELATYINNSFSGSIYTGLTRERLNQELNQANPNQAALSSVTTDPTCLQVAQCYLNAWADLPKIPTCPPPEVATTPTPKPPDKPPTPICPVVEGEKWGVRFKYGGAPSNSAKCYTPSSTITPTSISGSSTYVETKEWFLTLLPAMRTVLPTQGGMDTPNAMPGLQFRVMSNIAKHRVPGFQPIYQNLGVESLYITLVGTFTGDGGLGRVTRTRDIDTSPRQREVTASTDVNRAGARDIAATGNGTVDLPAQGPSPTQANWIPGPTWSVGDSVKLNVPYGVQAPSENSPSRFFLYPSANSQKFGTSLEEMFSSSPGGRGGVGSMEQIFKNSIDKGNVIFEMVKANEVPSGTLTTPRGTQSIFTSDRVNLDDPFSPLGVSTDIPSGATGVTTYNLHNEFLADGCPGECPKPGIDPLEKGHWNDDKSAHPTTYGSFRPLYEIASKLDSYHEFVSFYKLAMQQGNELEVEINTRKNKDGLYPRQGLDDDPLRDGKSGNPKFKGYVRRMEVYHARTDRTWYMIELEVTDHGLAGKKAINLTDDITQRVNEELALNPVQDTSGRAQCLMDTNNTWCKDIGRLDTGAMRKFCYSRDTGEGFYAVGEKAEDKVFPPIQTALILANLPRSIFSGIARWTINDVWKYFNEGGVKVVAKGTKPTPSDISTSSTSQQGLANVESDYVVILNLWQNNLRYYIHPSGYGVIISSTTNIVNLNFSNIQVVEPIEMINHILNVGNSGNIDDIKTYISSGTISIESKDSVDCSEGSATNNQEITDSSSIPSSTPQDSVSPRRDPQRSNN